MHNLHIGDKDRTKAGPEQIESVESLVCTGAIDHTGWAKHKVHSSQHKPKGEKADKHIQDEGDLLSRAFLGAIMPPETSSALNTFAPRVQVYTAFVSLTRAIRNGFDAFVISGNTDMTGLTRDLLFRVTCAK